MSQLISFAAFLLLALSFSHNSFSNDCPAGSSSAFSKRFSVSKVDLYLTYTCKVTRCGSTLSWPYDVSFIEGNPSQMVASCKSQCMETCEDEPEKTKCPAGYYADGEDCKSLDDCKLGSSLSSLTAACEPDDCSDGYYATSTGLCETCPEGTSCYKEPPPTCTAFEDLIDGVCVTRPPVCSGFDILVNGVCVSPPSPNVCDAGQILTNGVCVDPPTGPDPTDPSTGGGGSTPPPVTPDPEPLPTDPDPLPTPTPNPTPDTSDGYDRSANGPLADCSQTPSCDFNSPECRNYLLEWNNFCHNDGSNVSSLNDDFDPDSFKDSITEEIDLSQKINELSQGENWFVESCPAGYTLNFSFITLDVVFDPWCEFATKTKPIFLALIFFMVGRRIVIAASGGS